LKKLVALLTAAVLSLVLGVVYAEDETKMPWDNLPKGAPSTKEKKPVKNKDTQKKVAKIDKDKKTGKDRKKRAGETAK